ATDKPTTTLWRVDPSGTATQFAAGTISGFRVAPDSSAVAYLRKTDENNQVYIQALDGGEGRQVGDLPLGAVGVKWTPGGQLIALATLWMDHPTLEATAGHEPDER